MKKEIKSEFREGFCFACKQECEKGHYLHEKCAIQRWKAINIINNERWKAINIINNERWKAINIINNEKTNTRR